MPQTIYTSVYCEQDYSKVFEKLEYSRKKRVKKYWLHKIPSDFQGIHKKTEFFFNFYF